MAVLPISAVKVDGRNNGVNFTGIRKNKYSSEVNNDSVKSNDLAKVPVVLMIAMSPAMMKGKTPIQYVPISNENISELVAQPHIEENDATYVASPDEFQNSYPLGVAYLSNKKIRQIKPAIGNGVKANLVLATRKTDDTSNDVRYVYYIKHSHKSNNINENPPEVRELIYHNLGPDKEFLGIKIVEELYKDGHYDSFIIKEVKLDDTSAQFLLDFQAGDTEWNNKAGITFRETTNPNVAPPVKSKN